MQSKRLGLAVQQTADDYAKLLAASRGTELQGLPTEQIFLGVAEASTVLGLSQQDTSRVMKAVEQIISKQVVSAEELRQQMGDVLPGAFKIAARSMGLTEREFNKMLSTGRIMADDFLPKFAAELRRVYGPDVQRAIDSNTAKVNRLSSAWFRFRGALGDGVVNDFIGDVAEELSDGLDAVRRAGENVGFFSVDPQSMDDLALIKKEINDLNGEYFKLTTEIVRLETAFGDRAIPERWIEHFQDMRAEAMEVSKALEALTKRQRELQDEQRVNEFVGANRFRGEHRVTIRPRRSTPTRAASAKAFGG